MGGVVGGRDEAGDEGGGSGDRGVAVGWGGAGVR